MGAFLLLSAQASREAGRSIWLFKHGARDQRLPAMLFRVAFAGAVLWSPIAFVFGLSGRSAVLPESVVLDIAGNVMAAIGLAIAISSQVYMGLSWRIGAADGEVGAIVDTGPFALSRNPVFVGQVLLFSGVALAMPDAVHIALLTFVVIAVHRQVTTEEQVLTQSIGEPYQRYRARVRRWL